jgi:Ni/Co efflux regulator RcnB
VLCLVWVDAKATRFMQVMRGEEEGERKRESESERERERDRERERGEGEEEGEEEGEGDGEGTAARDTVAKEHSSIRRGKALERVTLPQIGQGRA